MIVQQEDVIRHRALSTDRSAQSVTSDDGNSMATSTKCLNFNPNQHEEEFRLKRRMGLFSGVAFIVGAVIGSGIFISPGRVLASAQSPGLGLTIWIFCGLYSLLGALAYSEIGTLIPKSGGEYIYFLEVFGPMHKVFGPFSAFIFAWMWILVIKPSTQAITSLSFAKYLSLPVLAAIDFCPNSDLSYTLTRLIAVLCISLIGFVNCYSVSGATWVENALTVAKLTAIAIIIGGGLYNISQGYTENLKIGFEGSATSYSEIAQGVFGGLYAYGGWNTLNFITEELQNPHRNLPKAIIIALPLTTTCYVLVNVSYLSVLTPHEIINSNAVALDWADKVLGPASFLIPIGVMMSVLGAANGSMFTTGRIAHVAGREGHAPRIMSYLHIEKRAPIAPVLLNSLLGILMVIPGDIKTLIDCFGFTSSISSCGVMVALIVMRFTKKNEHRPIKVPIVIPVVVFVVSAFLVIAPIVAAPQMQYLYVLLFILIGFFVYIPFVYYKKTVPGMEGLVILVQKLLLLAPPKTD